MRLYLIRHGETALNAKGCYYGRTDAVLSEKGISQARYLKEILKEISFDYIVASPLVRAYNTAQIVMEEREQEIFGDRRLMEQEAHPKKLLPYPDFYRQISSRLTAEYPYIFLPEQKYISMLYPR